MMHRLAVVVLAAGKGTRMRNDLRKVLHPLAGRSLIGHVMAVVGDLDPVQTVIVLRPGMDDVLAACREMVPGVVMAVQDPPMGTGHAVQAARDCLPTDGHVVVVFGDTPLITTGTLKKLVGHARETSAAVTVLGMHPPDPTGYGRLWVDNGSLIEIVEYAHANDELRRYAACNSGVMVFDATRLSVLLDELPLVESKQEYYLTDCIRLARDRGWRCATLDCPWQEGMGVNSQAQLAEANALLQERIRASLLQRGVIMNAPQTVHFAHDTDIEPGCVIEPFVVFGPGVQVKKGAIIRSHSHLEGAVVGEETVVGPFARLRPGTVLAKNCKVGNFVEAKNAVFGQYSKANHLSYIGDAELGSKVNIGAGTIICNYDGFNKHKTMLGDGAFIGSNTTLVAPIEVGCGAIVGAGSTITKHVGDDALALERAGQVNRPEMAARLRRRFKKAKESKS